MSSIELKCPACGDNLEVSTSLTKTRRGNCPDDCDRSKAHAHIDLKVKSHTCTFTAVVTDPTLPPQPEETRRRPTIVDEPKT